MGNNQAFSSFEASVIAVYNRGFLDKDLLHALASPYEGMDIDRGGMEGTLAHDGLDIDDIIFKVYAVKLPPKPVLPDDYRDWTPKQDAQNEKWVDKKYNAMSKIERRWGWR